MSLINLIYHGNVTFFFLIISGDIFTLKIILQLYFFVDSVDKYVDNSTYDT